MKDSGQTGSDLSLVASKRVRVAFHLLYSLYSFIFDTLRRSHPPNFAVTTPCRLLLYNLSIDAVSTTS